MFLYFQDKRADSYRYAVTPGGDAGKKKSKKAKKKENLDELKQELEMDEHKIPIEELYDRLGTNPNTVIYFSICIYPNKCPCHYLSTP